MSLFGLLTGSDRSLGFILTVKRLEMSINLKSHFHLSSFHVNELKGNLTITHTAFEQLNSQFLHGSFSMSTKPSN